MTLGSKAPTDQGETMPREAQSRTVQNGDVQLFLAHSVESPPLARRWARRVVAEDWGFAEETAYDVSLIVTELVTNSIEHVPRVVRGRAHGIAVRLKAQRGGLRVEVYDAGDRRPEVRAADSESEGGRGLLLVAGLSRRWGVSRRTVFGKVVWSEVAVCRSARETEPLIRPETDSAKVEIIRP
jgi:anti-sigma regulatory factor (Ser/Thr protein kinase)